MLQMGGQKPNRMLITFDSESESCCPSIGDITCDYTEAQAFAAGPADSPIQYGSRSISRLPSVISSPCSGRKPNHLSSPTQQQRRLKNNLIASPRKSAPSPQRHSTETTSPRKNRSNAGLPSAPKLSAPLSPAKSSGRNSTPWGGDIEFQMEGLSFRAAPPDVNADSIAAQKKRTKAINNNAYLNRSLEGLGANNGDEVVSPPNHLRATKSGPVLALSQKDVLMDGGNGSPKRRLAGLQSDVAVGLRSSPPAHALETPATKHRDMGQASAPKSPIKSSQSGTKICFARTNSSEIENSCLHSVSKNSVVTIRTSNIRPGREINLPGTNPSTSADPKPKHFLAAPLHENESVPKQTQQMSSDNGKRYSDTVSVPVQSATLKNSGPTMLDLLRSGANVTAPQELKTGGLNASASPQRRQNGAVANQWLNAECSSSSPQRRSNNVEGYSAPLENNVDLVILNDSCSNLEQSIRFDDGNATLALIEQENEMLKVALERSLHDVSCHTRLPLTSQNSGDPFGGASVHESGSGSRLCDDASFIDDDDDDDDDIDMNTALALSASIMDGSEGAVIMSRYLHTTLLDSGAGLSRSVTEGESMSTRNHLARHDDTASCCSRDDAMKYANPWK